MNGCYLCTERVRDNLLNRTTIIVIIIYAILILSIIGWGIAANKKPTPLEPISKDEVEYTNTAERRTLDVTEVISAEEFIVLRDFIVNKGEMRWLSQRFGQIPIIEYKLDKDNDVYFTVYEADRLGLQSDQIHIMNFRDTIDCDQYYIYYFPNGFDGANADTNNGLNPYINDYNDGHIYLVGSYDTGITDEQLMRQLAYYYSLLIRKP